MKIILPLLLLALLPACSNWTPYHESSTETKIDPHTGQETPNGYIAIGAKTTIGDDDKVDLKLPSKNTRSDKKD